MDTYDWTGWPLADNPFGREFDLEARRRMVEGSEALLPLLERYGVGERPLEVGPFFNPLVTPQRFPAARITYLDNDIFVRAYLQQQFGDSVIIINQDINAPLNVPLVISKQYTSVIASHVLNYIDFAAFLQHVPKRLVPRGMLFINNVLDYGIPALFSEQRPGSNEEIFYAIEKAGLAIEEQHLYPSAYPDVQLQRRLCLMARLPT